MKLLIAQLLVLSAVGQCAIAQDTKSGATDGVRNSNLASLEFAKPKPVEGSVPGSMPAGRFDCGHDGSVIALVAGDTSNGDPTSHVALLEIRPDGTKTSFAWWSVPGGAKASGPNAVFTGNGNVYVLVKTRVISEQGSSPSSHATILTFDSRGTLHDAVNLQEESFPLAFGVFPSGNILLVSRDRLNHRVGLSVVSRTGSPIRDISLGKDDFVTRAAESAPTARGTANYSPLLLVAMSKVLPVDGHLLLVPMETGDLPLVEIGEEGVLGSITPHLPADLVIEGLIAADSATYTLRVAKHIDSHDQEGHDADGKVLSIAIAPYQRLADISRKDGNLQREIDLGSSGIEPACGARGSYQLLTSGSEKRLEIVTARLK